MRVMFHFFIGLCYWKNSESFESFEFPNGFIGYNSQWKHRFGNFKARFIVACCIDLICDIVLYCDDAILWNETTPFAQYEWFQFYEGYYENWVVRLRKENLFVKFKVQWSNISFYHKDFWFLKITNYNLAKHWNKWHCLG